MKTLALLFLAAGAVFAADVSGNWQFAVETPAGSGSPSFTLKQEGEKLTGTYSGLFGELPVKGTVREGKISIEIDTSQGKIVYEGTVESESAMKGTVKLADVEGTFTGKKK